MSEVIKEFVQVWQKWIVESRKSLLGVAVFVGVAVGWGLEAGLSGAMWALVYVALGSVGLGLCSFGSMWNNRDPQENSGRSLGVALFGVALVGYALWSYGDIGKKPEVLKADLSPYLPTPAMSILDQDTIRSEP